MGSIGGESSATTKRKKALWLYPKPLGFNPSERWGHSSCFHDGVLYVFGGCCGGLHFMDVLALNLETMSWSSIATTGQRPGTRDSHSAAIVGHSMFVLGGTNGSRKVNDLHVLDLGTKEWSMPSCKGSPPSPRESHTASLIGDDKLVIFGGSGEGEANYLNDLFILDLKSMTWVSPEVRGNIPAPRDSHTAVAVGNKLFVYGGDCGDRYHGEVDVLDVDSLTWSTLAVQGSSPGVRAGHAAVTIGNKIYIIGGVGDKHYYSDVWVLDLTSCSWTQLETRGQQPQGRFSHTAVVTNADVAIYGGCGEDERPLNELLILQLGSEHPNGRYKISMCKSFSSPWNQEKRKFLRSENFSNVVFKNQEQRLGVRSEPNDSIVHSSDSSVSKRKKMGDLKIMKPDLEQEEHSLSLSQHSSPSLSDQEQYVVHKTNELVIASSQPFLHLQSHLQIEQSNSDKRNAQFLNVPASPRRQEIQFLSSDQKPRQEANFSSSEHRPQLRQLSPPLIGTEVRGIVDSAFDLGYLMTANINGQILRGILFTPGLGFVLPRPCSHIPHFGSPAVASSSQQFSAPSSHAIPTHGRPQTLPATAGTIPPQRSCDSLHLSHPVRSGHAHQPARSRSDLQGVVLTLGGPGCASHGGL